MAEFMVYIILPLYTFPINWYEKYFFYINIKILFFYMYSENFSWKYNICNYV